MPINICFIGDVMLGENHYHYGRGIRTRYGNNYANIIDENVSKILFGDIGLLFYNFEYSLVEDSFNFTCLENSIYRAKEDSLKVFPENIKRIINVANNHFSQYGSKSAGFTKNILEKQSYEIVGVDNKSRTIVFDDVIVKIWGVSLTRDDKYCNEYFYSIPEFLLDNLERTKKQENEFWIISLHWGNEYSHSFSEEQRLLAHKLIDHGFDLIIGHHPHVIQPIEIYNNAYIIYSLGNFIFDQNFSKSTLTGLVLKLRIENNKITTEIFQTYQKNYKVFRIIKKRTEDFVRIKSYINTSIIQFLMKLEILVHLNSAHPQTISFLLNRFKNKLFHK